MSVEQTISDVIALEKALNLYGAQVVSSGLEAEIPIEDIGHRFLAVVRDEEEAREFEHLLENLPIDHVKEVRIGDLRFYFEGE